eukprot:scaffold1.g5231.t1
MPAKKGSKSGEAYVEVGKEGTLDSLMAGKKAAAAGKRDAEDKAAKEPAKKAKKAKEPAPKKEAAPDEDVEMKDAVVGSGRQAAQNVSYKAKAVKLESKDDLVEVKELARCETEAQASGASRRSSAFPLRTGAALRGQPPCPGPPALGETAPPPGAASAGPLRARRLGDFSLCSEAGDAERIDSVLVSKAPIYISGVVYPKEGEASKATGRRAEKFGPLVSFSIDYSGKAAQADIAYEVHHALSPQLGGSAFATLEEVVARLARSKACKSYGSAREGLLVNGRFVLHQFEARGGVLDAASGGKALKYLDTDFGQALQKEVKSYKYVGSQRQAENGGGIHIARDAPAAAKPSAKDPKGKGKAAVDAEPTDEEKQLDADEQYARQLQAQMDAQERQRCVPGAAHAATLLPKRTPRCSARACGLVARADRRRCAVSEEEIADDYPFPQAYKKEEEETDELLLADEEMADVDPEYLPRRLLTDFAVYNAEGMFASLELLPMWSGVAPDVELYASGRVVDDDGDFSGGQSLEEGEAAGRAGCGLEPAGGSSSGAGGSSSGAGGSSSGAGGSSSAAAAEPAGMRMYLSQIREWVVEFGADMLFISLRTDVAWYRLSVPSEKYAPWFAVVLKTARLAAKVLTMLASESRASKVSFGDVVKRIAALPEGDACFISKKVERVERFVVAHGQIILNQFANYPVESVKRSGFAAVLKERMQQLRHCKLYKVARKAEPVRLRGVNRNPMSNQEVEEDENEEENEDDVQEDALAAGAKAGAKGKGRAGAKPAKPAARKLSWVGASTRTEDGDKFYAKAKLGDVEIALGDAVLLAADEDENEEEGSAAPPLALVQALWQGADGSKEVQVRLLARGEETVLGDAASDSEVFLTTALETHALGSVMGKAAVARLARTWDHRLRVEQFTQDQELRQARAGARRAAGGAGGGALWRRRRWGAGEADGARRAGWRGASAGCGRTQGARQSCAGRAAAPFSCAAHRPCRPPSLLQRNEEAAKEGRPLELFWRRQYVPQQGMFRDAPKDLQARSWRALCAPPCLLSGGALLVAPARAVGTACTRRRLLRLGTRLPEGDGKPAKGVKALADGKGFVKDGTEYREGDFLFVGPEVFDQLDAAQDKRERPEYLANSKFNKARVYIDLRGSYEGLRAWGIAQLVRLGAAEEKKGKGKKDAKTRGGEAKVGALTLRRYYRPEDIDRDKAYEAPSFYSVYASEEEVTVDVSDVVGPVRVVPQGYPTSERRRLAAARPPAACRVHACDCLPTCPLLTRLLTRMLTHHSPAPDPPCTPDITTFEVVGSFDHKKGKIGAAPEVPIPADLADFAPGRPTKADKAGKGKAVKEETEEKKFDGDDGTALATMDIFAGCGGLSEGMHQAGAAYTKWAIEYERPAAEAFRLNNPDAATFCNNCNVLLHAAMVKAGLGEDCLASKEAEEETARLPEEQREALPAPGEVDFICGGPPCQGYSGMNRFNKGNWSMVQARGQLCSAQPSPAFLPSPPIQNSMVMAFLSYADFYRPRYFLLENVRNFVSHNKSFTFRLTLRSLLDMGYQASARARLLWGRAGAGRGGWTYARSHVRFGVLNAGNFGVAQSRKRTFIWAAAPGELLPDWPRLMHCFRTPQLTINLPGNVQYTAVPQTVGAPLRPVTVRDAIGDLPAIESGEMRAEQEYDKPPASSFQASLVPRKFIRGDNTVLYDHISKQMNELNLERCRCIPKDVPGADWRELEEIVKADPGREKFKGQPLVPWCLPNTADRHNGWRGLFGRLDWHGHFPTSTTDPQPMGKVGQVFHCDQDRIVSVRECARAQGFPDRHRFAGNIHNKHRQVGNAVPPPLAAALGRELRRALEVTAQKRQQEAAMRE